MQASNQSKGETARLKTQSILPTYNCLTFSYHMHGRQMGKLSVYIKSYQGNETLLWSLFGQQSYEWESGEIPLNSNNVYEVCKA